MGGSLGAFLRMELGGLVRTASGAFWRALLVCLALGVALSLVAHRGAAGGQVSLVAQVAAGAVLGVSYGLVVALGVAVGAALWRLFGPALLVALVVAPLAAFAVLWLLRELLAASAVGFLDSVIASARQQGLAHTAEAARGMRASCGGAEVVVLLLVLLAPFLLADIALILTDAGVLLAFLAFAAAMVVALGAALLAALLLTSPVLAVALVRRGRRRFAVMAPVPRGQRPD